MQTSENEKVRIVFSEESLSQSKVDLLQLQAQYPNLKVVPLSSVMEFQSADVAVLPYKVNNQVCYEWLQHLNDRVQIIILDKGLSVPKTTKAMQSGVVDVLHKPVATERLLVSIERAVFLGRGPDLKHNAYLWNIFRAMEKMNQSHDETRLIHLFAQTVMTETQSRAAVIYKQNGTEWVPHLTLNQKRGVFGLTRTECIRFFAGLKKMNIDLLLPRYGRLDLPFRSPELGEIHDVLMVPVYREHGPLLCCFLDPPERLDARVNLEVLTSFAQHTSAALRAAKQYQKISELVYIDDVTGLYNARYLPLVLDHRKKEYERENSPFVILFIDLDRFKTVNDTFGHLVGSEILVQAGHVIRRSVRYDDAVFRYGGDEFIVILSNTDSRGGMNVAERIRRNLESHFFEAHGVKLKITASIGVGCFPLHGMNVQSVMDQADKALYEGKRRSRNIVLMLGDDAFH